MKKIAFIYRDISFQAPLGIMYLSAVLRRAGHECRLFIAEQDNLGELISFKPDFCCYTVTTANHRYYVDHNKKVRRYLKTMSLFGGPHATFFPEMINEEGIDGVCRGEGEEALLELVTRVDEKRDYLNTRNWSFKRDGKTVTNECGKLEMKIDDIPFPDRETFFKSPWLRRSKVWVFIGSRGCPYQCAYCHNHMMKALYGSYSVRFRSPENIIKEISAVRKKYPMRMAIFTDDTFNLNKQWLTEFAYEYSRCCGLPYACYVRADLMDEEVGGHLRRSNCAVVYMGIESGNERVRKEILNRPMTDTQILNASSILNKNGIKIVALNMIGIPGTSFSDDIDTLKLNIRCRPFQAVSQFLQPYPNTRIFDYSIKLKLFDEVNASGLGDFFTDTKIAFPHKHVKQVTYLRDLFQFFVRFPFLFNLFPIFLFFPRRIFYALAKIDYGYSKFRLFPVFNSPREIFAAMLNFYKREKGGTS